MIKNILIVLVLFFSFWWIGYAEDLIQESEPVNTTSSSQSNADMEKLNNDTGDISSPKFEIPVSSLFPWTWAFSGGTTEQVVNRLLGTIIQKLMIALGSISLLIMTVGAGYMVMYHGQDELLSKGKSIFMSGVIALVVALSSYYLVAFVRYVLYA